MFRPDADTDAAVRVALEALYDAADDDSATSGPDLARRIFPMVSVVTATGVETISEDRLAQEVEQMMAARLGRPDGPQASVTGGAS